MPKYGVIGKVVGAKHLGTFEAESEEKAIEMALEANSVNLCYYCSRKFGEPEITDCWAWLKEEEEDGQ